MAAAQAGTYDAIVVGGGHNGHRSSVQRIFPRLGETATTDDVLAMLDQTR
jgi:tRNA U34 5-carboxymethylaminomethyl modifying enzyme MnmG/GidA